MKKPQSEVAVRAALVNSVAPDLIDEFLRHFAQLRSDVVTQTLERASAGKVVETFVQILQWVERGSYEANPDVNSYLRSVETRAGLDEGLRICGCRLARAMYSIRNKRDIAHTSTVKASLGDLQLLYSCARWLLTELLRTLGKCSIREAETLTDCYVGRISPLVDRSEQKVLLLADVTATEEILLRLHHSYPDAVSIEDICQSLDRRKSASVRRLVQRLWAQRDIEGSKGDGYRLTDKGLSRVGDILRRVA
jgi:hypothetical protein